jgi:WD40 repeat protein
MDIEDFRVGLNNVRDRLRGTSTVKKIDALLDALQYGKEGLEVLLKSLSDRSREVRQSAFILLADCVEDAAKQATWNHLPFTEMQCLYTLTDLSSNSNADSAYKASGRCPFNFSILDCTNSLVCRWYFDYKHSFIQTWDLATGEPKKHCDLPIHEFGIGNEGRVFIATYQDNLWMIDPETISWERHGSIYFFTANHAAFTICSSKQPLVVAGHTIAGAGELEIRNYKTNECYLHHNFSGMCLFTQWVNSPIEWLTNYPPFLFTPNSELLVSYFYIRGNNKSVMKVWQADTGEFLHTLDVTPALTMMGLAVCPNGEVIVCGIREDKVCVWDLMSDRTIHIVDVFSPCIMSSDGRVLVYATKEHEVVIWDLVTSKRLCTLSGHTASINMITISSDREFIASHSADGTIRIWGIPEIDP